MASNEASRGELTLLGSYLPQDAQKLLDRLDTGQWHDVLADDLNNAAATLGLSFNSLSVCRALSMCPLVATA